MTLAATVPTKRSSKLEELNYLLEVDTTGDGGFDYWITLENRESGSWARSLFDLQSGVSYYDEMFQGSIEVVGRAIVGRIGLDALGAPTRVLVCGVTQRANGDDYGDVTGRR
jgi:hypothetical protein